ncbi:MAG TPA: polyprenyl synthetase family protein [Candidatus Bathyarchaeia archaeon]|nr:polyprenyl synthetase family protein [Candidatus Bathyarchaeia archaeon]
MSLKRAQLHGDVDGYQSYFEQVKRAIDSELSNLVPRISDLKLYKKIAYVLRTQGKRLRSTLLMLSGQSVDGEERPLRKLALSIELLHAATLVHDDILDQDRFRRNALSAYVKWSIRDAVLIGDMLAAISLNLAADYGEEILKIITQTGLLLCDGEYMDVEMAEEEMSETDYLEKIRKKSASLFKTATRCGAIAAAGSPLEIDCLAEFGENFGMAYQIKDDLSDIVSLKNDIPPDLREFRVTLPLVHAYESAKEDATRALLQGLKSQKEVNSSEESVLLSRLYESLETSGSLRYCVSKINYYSQRATTSLKPLRDSVYKSYLIVMAQSLRP